MKYGQNIPELKPTQVSIVIAIIWLLFIIASACLGEHELIKELTSYVLFLQLSPTHDEWNFWNG